MAGLELSRLTTGDLQDLADAIESAVEHDISEFNFLVKRFTEQSGELIVIGIVRVQYDGAESQHYIKLA